jgi:CMP-N-acetylneuraminic acid synthetase
MVASLRDTATLTRNTNDVAGGKSAFLISCTFAQEAPYMTFDLETDQQCSHSLQSRKQST